MMLRTALGLSLAAALTAAPAVYAEKATLNLKDTDIRVLVETVSRLTGKTFLIDRRVTGTVTVISQHPMSEEEIYQTFLSAIKMHGFAAVQTGPVIKIVQEAQAKGDSTAVSTDKNPGEGEDLVTRVIKVKNLNINNLVPVLRGLVAQQAHLAPMPPNSLIISDRAANVNRVVQIINQMDTGTDKAIVVMPLRHASAAEVVRILEELDKQQPGQEAFGATNKPSVVADERTNSILISGDESQRLRLKGLVAHLDTPLQSTGNTKVIYLRYAKADKLAKVLKGVSENLASEEAKAKGQQGGGAGRKDLVIEAHEETNAIVMTAPPSIMAELESIVRKLDIRRAQVLVEAIIVEISDNKAKELGVQWLFGGGKDGKTRPVGFSNFNNTGPGIVQLGGAAAALNADRTDTDTVTTVTDPDTGNVITTRTPGGNSGNTSNIGALASALSSMEGIAFGAARIKDSGLNFAALVRALASDTDSNILSTPSLMTLDNEEAEFKAGQEVPFLTGSYQTQAGGGGQSGGSIGNPFQTIERKDVGVTLKIKPQINEGNAVRLAIEQEVSSIAGATQTDVITNKRSIKNSVMVGDGQTVILGGLIDEDVQQSAEKVPFLGDIPGLGVLFRSSKTTKVKRNLMVFIKPTIVRDDTTMAKVSGEKYNFMRVQQLKDAEKGIDLMADEKVGILPEFNDKLALPPSFEDSQKEGAQP
ncbi:MAG: type II secretion system secretin GspD [Gammaproteobacteria bacterium]|nr:type II secretion system secretin GspD [Gammaproteobacteria bacterium]